MKFRPCIDIHNGKVKQIVGGSLSDERNQATENFTASFDADYYAGLYRKDGLTGGHVILLNPPSSPHFPQTKKQAVLALKAYPGGLQIGGGITAQNARDYLQEGASHVIVTSYIFNEGHMHFERMENLCRKVGKERVVFDLSCRERNGAYYIVTDRWQKFTEEPLTEQLLDRLSQYCDEYLVHGVDVEGKSCGFEEELVEMLGRWTGNPITYAGGIATMEDVKRFEDKSRGNLDFTVGSALDLFGGKLPYKCLIL